jgi:hypothetical protein
MGGCRVDKSRLGQGYSAGGARRLGSVAGAGARRDLISVVSDGGDAQKAKQHVGEKA